MPWYMASVRLAPMSGGKWELMIGSMWNIHGATHQIAELQL